jgi:hypothetical protein
MHDYLPQDGKYCAPNVMTNDPRAEGELLLTGGAT